MGVGGTPQLEDLHGSVPDRASVALLLIDVLNDLDFPGNEELIAGIQPLAERIATLRERARANGIPTVYVNDNFGRWRSDRHDLIEHLRATETPGRPLAERLLPHDDDYFVLKPKHSGFYSTILDTLLAYLGARTLILAGIAGNICVFFTANDAYMRDFALYVPSDCVASNTQAENEYALGQMRQVLRADITPSAHLDLGEVLRIASQTARNSHRAAMAEHPG